MVHDCIIIGAGPAGGMAARALSGKGRKVLVLEKKDQVGIPVQCGEAMTRFALEENGLRPKDSWIAQKVKGSKPIMPDGSFFYAGEPGYSIYRDRFDQWVMNGAVDGGAELRTRTRVTGIERKGKNWVVKTKAKDLEARLVIAADGGVSNVARWLGIIQQRKYVTGIDYKFKKEDLDYPEEEWLSFHMSARFMKGYGWVFPRGDQWGVGCGGYGDNGRILKDYLKFLKVDPSKRIAKTAGLIPNHYILKYLARDGLMLVGDAGGMTNPTFGGGIHAALSSGRMAGETACKALSADDPSLVAEYEARIKREPYLKPEMYTCANYIQSWSDEDWNFLGQMLNGRDQADVGLFGGIGRAIKIGKFGHALKRGREFLLVRKVMKVNLKYGW